MNGWSPAQVRERYGSCPPPRTYGSRGERWPPRRMLRYAAAWLAVFYLLSVAVDKLQPVADRLLP